MSKQQKQFKFSDLKNLKKKIPIIFEGEKLFEMHELNTDKLSEFILLVKDSIEKTDENSPVLGLKTDLILFLLKNMIKGINIESYSDEEIVEIIKESSSDIQNQIGVAIKELVTSKIEDLFKNINTIIQKNN